MILETQRQLDQANYSIRANNEFMHDVMIAALGDRWDNHLERLVSRREVGYWLNWLGLIGKGVEVGVFRGEFSAHLLNTWQGNSLASIDPWMEFPTSEYNDVCNLDQEGQDQNHEITVRLLESFGGRSRIIKNTSHGSNADFADGTLDFVYLDAQHHYSAVKEDIEIWFPKIVEGGVLGGHDYLDGIISSGDYGVKSAVDEFAAARGFRVIVTNEPIYKSWFIRVQAAE